MAVYDFLCFRACIILENLAQQNYIIQIFYKQKLDWDFFCILQKKYYDFLRDTQTFRLIIYIYIYMRG